MTVFVQVFDSKAGNIMFSLHRIIRGRSSCFLVRRIKISLHLPWLKVDYYNHRLFCELVISYLIFFYYSFYGNKYVMKVSRNKDINFLFTITFYCFWNWSFTTKLALLHTVIKPSGASSVQSYCGLLWTVAVKLQHQNKPLENDLRIENVFLWIFFTNQ